MDTESMSKVFGAQLYKSLSEAGVKKETLKLLEEDEMIDVETLDGSSDSLIRSLGIKGAQIVRLRKGVALFKDDNQDTQVKDIDICVPSPESVSVLEVTVPKSPSSSCEESLEMSSDSTILGISPLSFSTPERSESPRTVSFDNFKEKMPAVKKNWIKDFELPTQFSPTVTNELSRKDLSANRRNEFTRDICSSIRVYTLNPTRVEREHISLMIVKRYPFLADTLGNPISSWQESIRNRFKNVRKTKRACDTVGAKCATSKKLKPQSDQVPKRRSVKQIPEMPEGETEETCMEHVGNIKKELLKTTNKNFVLVKQLMELTFAYRRKQIVSDTVTVKELVEIYPALQFVSELKAEFGRVTGDEAIVKDMNKKFENMWQQNFLALARKKKVATDLFSEAANILLQEPDKKTDLDESIAVLALPMLLKDHSTNPDAIIKICLPEEDIDKEVACTTAPRIVGSGSLARMQPLYLVVEGVIVTKLHSVGLINVMSLLVGSYYIFNMEYPANGRNYFLFLEAVLMDRISEAKKRVSINKLLKDLK